MVGNWPDLNTRAKNGLKGGEKRWGEKM